MRPETVADLYSPEQFKTFIFVLAALMAVNAGAIVSAFIGWLYRSWKTRQDLNQAFQEIRKIQRTLKGEQTDEKL
jgi:hypothetical protein